jgi:hypothetical protein
MRTPPYELQDYHWDFQSSGTPSGASSDPAAEVVRYVLPDRRVVEVPADVCRWASTVEYTLADGRIVTAVVHPDEEPF